MTNRATGGAIRGAIRGATGGLCLAALVWYGTRAAPLDLEGVCVQYPPIAQSHFNHSRQFEEEAYLERSARLLGGAVQIPTESFDDMAKNVREDERFAVFKEFHRYLDAQFPLMAAFRETVNDYALLYTVPAAGEAKAHASAPGPAPAPILFMAHQDVVPVNPATLDQWDYPPFSGHYDGEFLYGRGSVDTKNSLVAQLEALENLLAQGWAPSRPFLLAYGCDEELDGSRGAKHLSATIQSRYGKHGVALILDEGSGLERNGDSFIASPAVAEKGIVDFEIQLQTPGGHSSAPPDHTGIGIIAQLARTLEANPLEGRIESDSIYTEIFGCLGRWKEGLDPKTRRLYTNLESASARAKLVEILDENRSTRYFARTSQAIDVVRGGLKVNALPEQVTLEVDYRIAVHQSIQFLRDRLQGFVLELCKEHGLGLEIDHETIAEGPHGRFNISSFGGYDPAPVSPISGKVWESIAGVTRNVFPGVVVAPTMMGGNTDTGSYWDVSREIYRYSPCLEEDSLNLHTVNEKLRFQSHISALRWFYEFAVFWGAPERAHANAR